MCTIHHSFCPLFKNISNLFLNTVFVVTHRLSSCDEQGLLFIVACELLSCSGFISLWSTGSGKWASLVVAGIVPAYEYRLYLPSVCGILLDQNDPVSHAFAGGFLSLYHQEVLHSFLLLNNISRYGYTIFYSFLHQLMNFIVSTFGYYEHLCTRVLKLR